MKVLSDGVYVRIRKAVQPGQMVVTPGFARPNRVVEIGPQGLLVETERSLQRGSGPRLVPAKLEADWEALGSTGTLTSEDAGHRGSFTGALFALFDDVEVVSSRPRVLRHVTEPR